MTKKSRSQLTTMDKFSLGVLSLAAVALVVGIFTHKNVTPKQVTATVPVLKDVVQPQDVVQNKPADVEVAPKHIYTLKVTKDNSVLLFGEIGAEAATVANQILAKSNNNEPTLLLINSPGGSVLDGALIVSAVEASNTPVYAVCMQLCASMASLIHGHASARLMVDRSILMFHPASGSLQGTTNQMYARLSTLTRYVDKMDAMIAARAGISLESFLQRKSGELWIDAEDAVDQHFADAIVSLDLSSISQDSFNASLNQSTLVLKQHFGKLSDF